MPYDLPGEARAVVDKFRVCEFSTQAKDLTPITHPLCSFLRPDGTFLLSTSIGLPTKAFNIRRNPKVSMLFSEPTGSGLSSPATVLVQGDATAPDDIITDVQEHRDYWLQRIYRRQPDSAAMSSWLMRSQTWWYFLRIMITVTPRRIQWWPHGDLSQPAQQVTIATSGTSEGTS